MRASMRTPGRSRGSRGATSACAPAPIRCDVHHLGRAPVALEIAEFAGHPPRMDGSKHSTGTDSTGAAESEGKVLAPRTWCPACVRAGTRLGQRDLGWRDLEARARR